MSDSILDTLGQNTWCELALEKIVSSDDDTNHIITDLRFMREYEFFKSKFGDDAQLTVIRIVKHNGDTFQREDETEIIPAQYIVENDGTIEDFEKKTGIDFNQRGTKNAIIVGKADRWETNRGS
jgi:hypothetical protein